MAPSVTDAIAPAAQVIHQKAAQVSDTVTGNSTKPAQVDSLAGSPHPLEYKGTLDEYASFDVTQTIGREYPTVQLSEIIKDEAKIRDLAITVSQRGVVFFRKQDITVEQQKYLGQKLGELTGKPASSGLHKHALLNSKRANVVGADVQDDEVSVISSDIGRSYRKVGHVSDKRFASSGWHSDITFERIPSDYAILKIHTLPETGGDTLWASGYEAYDKLSPTWRKFAEGLTATHFQPLFLEMAKKLNYELLEGAEQRGSPENIDLTFKASHPVVRTNPVTGWKSLVAVGGQVLAGWIDDVTPEESDLIKNYFNDLIAKNHDLQVRFRWGKDDVAIWDNRSVFHTATWDYEGKRVGNRVVSLGEKPYFDPKSVSRREGLGLDQLETSPF